MVDYLLAGYQLMFFSNTTVVFLCMECAFSYLIISYLTISYLIILYLFRYYKYIMLYILSWDLVSSIAWKVHFS